MCACVRACVRAWVRACVRACVCLRVRVRQEKARGGGRVKDGNAGKACQARTVRISVFFTRAAIFTTLVVIFTSLVGIIIINRNPTPLCCRCSWRPLSFVTAITDDCAAVAAATVSMAAASTATAHVTLLIASNCALLLSG